MKLTGKRFWLLATVLLVVGLLTILSAFIYIGFDFTRLNSTNLEQKTVAVEEPFHSIYVDADWFNVTVLPKSEGGAATVLAPDGTNLHTEISVREGILTIEVKDIRLWYQSFFSYAPGALGTITLYLPEGAYGNLTILSDTGDVSVDSGAPEVLFFEKAKIETSTGDVFYHADMPVDTPFLIFDTKGVLELITSTGDVTVCNTDAYVLHLYTTTGDVSLSEVSVRECSLTTSTGDVCLQNLQGDVESTTLTLYVETSTGDVAVTDTVLAHGEVTTSTGDVTVSGGSTRELSLKTSTGDVEILQYTANFMSIETSTGDVLCDGISSRRFDVRTSSGDVTCPASAKKGDYCAVTTSSGDVCIVNTPAE